LLRNTLVAAERERAFVSELLAQGRPPPKNGGEWKK